MRNLRISLIYLLNFFVCIEVVHAQSNELVRSNSGQIIGTVVANNDQPIVAASVQLLGTSHRTITDEQGIFRFNNLGEGLYRIKILSIEIEPFEQEIVIDHTLKRIKFNVKPASSQQLEEVYIERKTIKKEIELSGFAAHVIETKSAALRNAQTNDLLDRSVGVRVRQQGGLGAAVDYNLNGMSGNAVGIFIDGIAASTYGSSFNLSTIPPALIERIEVYKGVLPAHLSGDLLGGAINVVLKKEANNHVSASVSYGSFNTFQSNFNAHFRKKSGFTFRASGFYSSSDNDYEIWGRFARNTLPDGTMEETKAKRFFDAFKSYGGRMEFGGTSLPWADVFLLGLNASHAYNELQHGLYMTQPYMGRFTESDVQALSLNYEKDQLFNTRLNFKINGVYSWRDQYVQDTVSYNYNWSGETMIGFHGKPLKTAAGAQQGAPTMNTIGRTIGTLRSDLAYTLTKNHQIGINYVYYTVDREDFDALRPIAEQKYRSTNDLYKQITALRYAADWLEGNLRTNVFGKWYHQAVQRNEPYVNTINGQSVFAIRQTHADKQTWGYGFALSYTPLPNLHILSSAERAVRLPNENELFGGADENIVANPLLRPEISDNLNLGLRYQFYPNDLHRFSFGVTGFIRDTKDKIVRKAEDRLVNEAVQTMPFENLGLAQSLGFEGEFTYDYNRKLQVLFNFSKFNALFKQEFDPVSGLKMERYNKQLPNEPFFTANASVQYSINHVFQHGATLQMHYGLGYVDSYQTIWIKTKNTTTPRQIAQDLGLTYQFPKSKMVWSLDVKNLFNEALYDNFAVQKPGRAFYFKVSYSLNHLSK